MSIETQRVVSLMRAIRQKHFHRTREYIDPTIPVVYWEETNRNGQPFNVPLIILRTPPCQWFSSGGCVMCNYELLAIDEGVSSADLIQQIDWAQRNIGPLSQYNYVFVTSQGSFLDDREIPSSVRLQIARRLRELNIQALATESEAKYCVDRERVLPLRDELGCPLSIGIGLEAYDSFIRITLLNKGLTDKLFLMAATSLTRDSIGFYTYILLGKPFLSTHEDIEDALKAITFSFDAGASMCVVELVNIQPYTLTYELFKRDLYTPPSLWSAIELLNRLPLRFRSRVSIKGCVPDIEPMPIALAKGCTTCTPILLSSLSTWNLERDMSIFDTIPYSCSCRQDWLAKMEYNSMVPIKDRLDRTLTILEHSIASGKNFANI